MKYVGWDEFEKFHVFEAEDITDAVCKCQDNESTFIGNIKQFKEDVLKFLKEQKVELQVVVDMFGGGFSTAYILTNKEAAIDKEIEIEDLYCGDDRSEVYHTKAVIE